VARILLADDNLGLRQLIKGLIEAHAGWQICGEAGDGYEAVAKAAELRPDLVVMDFAMPGLNGLQAAAKIFSSSPKLPVVLHTVHFFPEMIAEAKKVGIRNVVNKSETAGQLLDVIGAILQEQPAESASLLNALPQPGPMEREIDGDRQKLPEPEKPN
jgi:DNA-binding NarL/FixJ family response regulator